MLSFGACQGRISTLQAYSSAARTPSVTRHGVQVITVRPFKSQHPLLHRRIALPSRHCGLCRATSPGEATEKEALVKRDTEHVDQLTSTTENEHNYANGKENGVAEATADAAAQPANQNLYIAASVAAVFILGIGNRVLYKLALVPLSDYSFFLAQLQTFGYLAVYFSVLAYRFRAGKITSSMIGVAGSKKKLLFLIGGVEAVSSVLGFYGASQLPGVVLPLLGQTVLFWQVFFALTLLKKRLSTVQMLGVALVVLGVSAAAWPSNGSSPLANVNLMFAAIYCASMIFPALDSILKERLFREAKETLKGKDLDLFVVNSFGSLAQSACILLLLPLLAPLRGIPLSGLPGYLAEGWSVFWGLAGGATGAPMLPLLYIGANLAFNIAALNLVRSAGNVITSLVMASIVPFTIYAFTFDLPFLPLNPPLGLPFLLGTVVMVAGLALYNGPQWIGPVRGMISNWLNTEEA
ncbi:hypothetical protein ACKKBG_A39320 [Auxenochlorella protothecoides x Auxenochlorella symbiontica]